MGSGHGCSSVCTCLHVHPPGSTVRPVRLERISPKSETWLRVSGQTAPCAHFFPENPSKPGTNEARPQSHSAKQWRGWRGRGQNQNEVTVAGPCREGRGSRRPLLGGADEGPAGVRLLPARGGGRCWAGKGVRQLHLPKAGGSDSGDRRRLRGNSPFHVSSFPSGHRSSSFASHC